MLTPALRQVRIVAQHLGLLGVRLAGLRVDLLVGRNDLVLGRDKLVLVCLNVMAHLENISHVSLLHELLNGRLNPNILKAAERIPSTLVDKSTIIVDVKSEDFIAKTLQIGQDPSKTRALVPFHNKTRDINIIVAYHINKPRNNGSICRINVKFDNVPMLLLCGDSIN